MRVGSLVILLLSVLMFVLPPVSASPAGQFAGCADEIGEQFGARYLINQVRGINLTVVAIGIDGFDPNLTVLDPSGAPLGCSDDSREALNFGAGLPNVKAPANQLSALVSVTLPADTPPQDLEIIVTSANRQSGEFVLIIDGVEIYGADNVDEYIILTNEGQVVEEVPLGIYAANTNRPEELLAPVIRFSYGSDFEQTCYKSSAAVLCDGEPIDMTGYNAMLDGEQAIFNGDDVMLYYEIGSQASVFRVEVSSYQNRTFGPYTLFIYSGVGYPSELGQ